MIKYHQNVKWYLIFLMFFFYLLVNTFQLHTIWRESSSLWAISCIWRDMLFNVNWNYVLADISLLISNIINTVFIVLGNLKEHSTGQCSSTVLYVGLFWYLLDRVNTIIYCNLVFKKLYRLGQYKIFYSLYLKTIYRYYLEKFEQFNLQNILTTYWVLLIYVRKKVSEYSRIITPAPAS